MMLCMIQRWYTMYCIVHVVLTFYLVKCYTQHCPLVLVITKTMLCIFWHFILIPLDNLWEEKVLFANIFAILKMSFVQCVGLRTAKSGNRSWTQKELCRCSDFLRRKYSFGMLAIVRTFKSYGSFNCLDQENFRVDAMY